MFVPFYCTIDSVYRPNVAARQKLQNFVHAQLLHPHKSSESSRIWNAQSAGQGAQVRAQVWDL